MIPENHDFVFGREVAFAEAQEIGKSLCLAHVRLRLFIDLLKSVDIVKISPYHIWGNGIVVP